MPGRASDNRFPNYEETIQEPPFVKLALPPFDIACPELDEGLRVTGLPL
jgi:hypothetical protein